MSIRDNASIFVKPIDSKDSDFPSKTEELFDICKNMEEVNKFNSNIIVKHLRLQIENKLHSDIEAIKKPSDENKTNYLRGRIYCYESVLSVIDFVNKKVDIEIKK